MYLFLEHDLSAHITYNTFVHKGYLYYRSLSKTPR